MNGATMSLEDLRGDHAQLLGIIRDLEVMVDGDLPPPPVELFEVRRRLSGVLIGHLKAADWLLYPPLLASADPQIAGPARRLADEMGGISQTFSVFVGRWDALAIQGDWARYQAECKALIKALTQRIVREKQELYPLLEKLARAA